MKQLQQAAAFLLFGVFLSGPAMSALQIGSGSSPASLALVVYDPLATGADSPAYIRDLGVTFPQWNTVTSKTGSDLANLATDSNWTSFLSMTQGQSIPLSALVVQIVSWNQAVGSFSILATGNAGATIIPTNYSKAFTTAKSFYTQLNTLQIGTSIVTQKGGTGVGVGYPGNAGSIGTQFGGNFNKPLGGGLDTEINIYRYDQTKATAFLYGAIELNSKTAILSYAPVPEPGTWALLLIGLGAVGFCARRRGVC